MIEIEQILRISAHLLLTKFERVMASTSAGPDKYARGGSQPSRSHRAHLDSHHSRKNIYIERDIPTFDWEESGQPASYSRKPPKHRRSPHVPSTEAPSHRRGSSYGARESNAGSIGPGLREIIAANEKKSGNISEIKVGISQVCSALRAWSTLSGLPSIAVPSALASRVEGNLRRMSEDSGGSSRTRPVSSNDVMPAGIPLNEVAFLFVYIFGLSSTELF